MKINNNSLPPQSQVPSKALEDAQNVEKAQAKNTPSKAVEAVLPEHVGASSDVQISDQTKLMQKAHELAQASPETRADRIADLKQRIQSGSYQFDAGSVAERILEEHLFSDFGKNSL